MNNAYELRAKLLKEVTDLMTQQYAANMQAYQDLAKSNTKTFEQLMGMIPQYPTADQIVEEAKKFYAFVNTK
jgi:cell division protein FtsB